ncbi:MAG: cytochrome C [Gammaproteobacteria bacterium]|nr:cytochrome C [Gammaproteobacteria bacterium]
MRRLCGWMGIMTLLVLAAPAAAAGDVMNRMMQGLGAEMARINEGIWREDFEAIAGAAAAIAEHPLPPLLQRLELLAQLGTAAPRFMAADDEMREAALALKEAAEGGRIDEVVSRYQPLQQRCVACHRWYRRDGPGAAERREIVTEWGGSDEQ